MPTTAEDTEAGTPPASVSFCPFLNKRGLACLSPPLNETGICLEHSKKVAKAIPVL